MSWLIRSIGCAALAMACPSGAMAQSGPQPRVEIALFKYHGPDGKFDVFQGLVKQKIVNLRNQVLRNLGQSPQALDYLKRVHMNYRGDDTFLVSDDVLRWIENEGLVLSAMRGTILSDDGTHYVVVTQFHVPADIPGLPTNVVTVELPVTSAEFGNARDSHTAVILYSLAIDAQRRKLDPAYIAAFVGVAKNLLADIERRSNGLKGDLATLKEAVEDLQQSLLGDKP